MKIIVSFAELDTKSTAICRRADRMIYLGCDATARVPFKESEAGKTLPFTVTRTTIITRS